jgi:Tfp pilus assembly protein PilN
MLRTNFATRPFYNERAAQLVLGVLAIVVFALTLANAVEYSQLSDSESRLGSSAAESEREAARLRAEATAIRTRIDPRDLETVVVAAREANDIIDQRAFSWTALFGRLESTLPADVRVKAVQPRLDKGTFSVTVVAEGRTIQDLADFMDALEATGVFRDVRLVEQSVRNDLLEAVVDGIYLAPARMAPEAAP